MRRINRWTIALAACLAVLASAPRARADRVDHAVDTVRIAGPGFPLAAVLFRPAGPGPFPAVVGLHGCEGLGGGADFDPRYREWAERLTASGFVVLFPDSFSSRNIGPQCREPNRSIRSDHERVVDANAARRWLQDQPFVKPDRISLLGWSNGASTLLWAVRPRAIADRGKPDFRSAVALYPGCRRSDATGWSARAPTLILIGDADDWTPARACEQMVAGARGRSARVSIIVYPGAHHGFDKPDRPLTRLTGMATSADGSGVVHVGTDPAARADAFRRAIDWLSR